jgi:hypothetical protein
MPAIQHCRHCWGACAGDCLLPGQAGLCIHQPLPRRTRRQRLRLLGTRRWWSRRLRGPGPLYSGLGRPGPSQGRPKPRAMAG